MQCYTYRNLSSQNVVSKNLVQVGGTLNGQLKEQSNVSNPTITFAGQPNKDVNYFYIPEFGRYYYLREITILNGNKYQVSMKCDVLKTYESMIRNGYAYVNKADHGYGLGLTSAGVNPPAMDTMRTYGYDLNGPNFVPEGGMFVLTVAG